MKKQNLKLISPEPNKYADNKQLHYASYGSVMPGRVYAGGVRYKYKFNGKETDDETFEGCVAFEFRIFDARVCKFLSKDPWCGKYPWQTPYAYFANSPIGVIDFMGLGTIDNQPTEDDLTLTGTVQDAKTSNPNQAGATNCQNSNSNNSSASNNSSTNTPNPIPSCDRGIATIQNGVPTYPSNFCGPLPAGAVRDVPSTNNNCLNQTVGNDINNSTNQNIGLCNSNDLCESSAAVVNSGNNSNKTEPLFIKKLTVDISKQTFTITWGGTDANKQSIGPFLCSTGAGNGTVDCDDPNKSGTNNSNCTPHGDFTVCSKMNSLAPKAPEATWVVMFQCDRGIAFHYYPIVPPKPASHGCVRVKDLALAKKIHSYSIIGKTTVSVTGSFKKR